MIQWKKALDLEVRVAEIINEQEENGVQFDIDKAHKHVQTLTDIRSNLYEEIRPDLDMEVVAPFSVSVNKPFLMSGGYSKATCDWMLDNVDQVGGVFTRVRFEEPDIGSRQKLIKQLLKHGWKPVEFTLKGTPRITNKGVPVDSLAKIKGGIGSKIAEWFTAGHRKSQIEGWINKIRDDGRLTAGADSCGTNTARMRHRNVVNVPKAHSEVFFGHEMRDLFIASPDKVICGHDASGLEARMMAHYTFPYDDGEFANEILHGDIHSKNTYIFYDKETEGLRRGDEGFDKYRDGASKSGFYGLVYGAQIPKLCSTLNLNRKRGKKAFNDFWEKNYALGELRNKIMSMAENRGWIPGLDGRKIYVRSSHSALNALFQSAGSIVMKTSMVILDHWAKKEGLGYQKVIDMHDEGQAELDRREVEIYEVDTKKEALALVRPNEIWMPPSLRDDKWVTGYSRYGELAVKSIQRAGTYLNLRCPLDAEYKLGRSWAETH